MYSFLLSLLALVLGYFLYGHLIEKIFGPDPNSATPAIEKADGVDFVRMPSWRVFMVQFLNIAGTGPIFGAIMGAKFGPSSYLWIVLGCIFAGAVHDYLTGMMSVRNGGAGLPVLVGKYLGQGTRRVLGIFSILVLLLVGTVFVYSPALILGDIAGDSSTISIMIWVLVIFLYYILASILPIDKIVGKIYPVFAFALIFMALALLGCLLVKWPSIPEIWDGLGNLGQEKGLLNGQPIFPCLFITIACGAVSGFHATQSPLMARCLPNERYARPVFYGAMITEGIVALVWAAAATYFYQEQGMSESNAAVIVDAITKEWLGVVGGLLAVLGVIAAPITSGDTAFRSARLIVADFLHVEQHSIVKRLLICVPMFIVAIGILLYSQQDAAGFDMIWRYFAWTNQTLAVFTLWALTVYLAQARKNYWITLLPALFMSAVCSTYILVAPEGLHLPTWPSQIAGIVIAGCLAIAFFLWRRKMLKEE